MIYCSNEATQGGYPWVSDWVAIMLHDLIGVRKGGVGGRSGVSF